MKKVFLFILSWSLWGIVGVLLLACNLLFLSMFVIECIAEWLDVLGFHLDEYRHRKPPEIEFISNDPELMKKLGCKPKL